MNNNDNTIYTIYGILYIPENRCIYVGQTTNTLSHRMYYHCVRAANSKKIDISEDRHYYTPMAVYMRNKSQMDNDPNFNNFKIFEIATTYDQQEGDQLEREYIKRYNTLVPFGCNKMIGGKSIVSNIDILNQVESLYMSGMSTRDIEKEIGISRETARAIINNSECTYIRDSKHVQSVHVYALDINTNQIIMGFYSFADAARFLMYHRVAQGTQETAERNIRSVVKGKKLTAYGYKWITHPIIAQDENFRTPIPILLRVVN